MLDREDGRLRRCGHGEERRTGIKSKDRNDAIRQGPKVKTGTMQSDRDQKSRDQDDAIRQGSKVKTGTMQSDRDQK